MDLFSGTASGGDATGDTFDSIENVTGSSANDTLVGNREDNVLAGGSGNDSLAGGAGDDYLYGNGGNDVFVFSNEDDADGDVDFVTDFDSGDRIDFLGFGDLDFDSLKDVTAESEVEYEGNSGLVQADALSIDLSEYGGGTIHLVGYSSLDDLSSDWFMFG